MLTTRFDGGGPPGQGMIIWEEGPTFDKELVVREVLSASPASFDNPAAGFQYCDANAHGSSSAGGRESSWLSIFGTRCVDPTHKLVCQHMQPDAFAFFIASQAAGDVNLPGGSAGRLCLSGAIGRRVGGVLTTSGPAGYAEADFTPQVLPTPNGNVAALPGESWYFQCWHRDVAAGLATSNFSNACALTFRS